jgi:hypothetical protein
MSSIKFFRDEYLAHVTNKGCPYSTAASGTRELAGAHS